jgi:hypothetical protein
LGVSLRTFDLRRYPLPPGDTDICYTMSNSVTWRRKSLIMKEPVKMGRHAEIVPKDGTHYVLVDGQEWSRHDDLAVAEGVRNMIVAG